MASHEHMHFVHLNKNSCVMPPKFDDVLHFCMQIFLACVGDCARFLRRAVLGDESNFGHHHQQIDKPDAEAIREKEERGLALGWAVSNPGFSGRVKLELIQSGSWHIHFRWREGHVEG